MGKDIKGKELGKHLLQRKDGRYEAKYTDNFGKRHSIYGDKLADVRKRLNEALYQKEHSIYSEDFNMTLNEWFDIYTKVYYVKKVKFTTYSSSIAIYDCHIRNSCLGQMPLKEIKNIHIQSFLNDLTENQSLKRGTIIDYLSPLKVAFRQAVKCGYIQINPTDNIIIPQQTSRTSAKKEALTKKEQDLFLSYAEKTVYFHLFQFLLLTGLRSGEALALTWDDIDMENRLIKIDKNLSVITGERKEICRNANIKVGNTMHTLTTPKTNQSIRTIPISDSCYQVLSVLFESKNKETNLVFHTKRNNYVSVSNVNVSIKKICEHVNKDSDRIKPFSSHTFRHTFATRCFENGLSAKMVQELLGHSNMATTMNVYTHITQDFAFNEINKVTL